MGSVQRAERPEPSPQELIPSNTHGGTLESILNKTEIHGLAQYDWSATLAKAPVCVATLGECLLFCSFENASRLNLDGDGLK